MATKTTTYPIDILLCLLLSVVLVPIAIFNTNGLLRILLGLPFILFIPGYLVLQCLFPYDTTKSELDAPKRVGISLGLSMSLVPLTGILLYYSPYGLTFISILTSIFFIIIISGIGALYQWQKLRKKNHYKISVHFPAIKSKSVPDKILMILLCSIIVITIITALYVSLSFHKQETSTEFYLLGPTGKTINYPKNITRDQNSNVTIGLINHEQKSMNYTVEIWLVNQTLSYDNATQTNVTEYHQMWFMDKITVSLNNFFKTSELIWQPQWEYSYDFRINRTGRYTLMFLLFTEPTQEYIKYQNYQNISAIKIPSAYESIYIWLNVHI